MNGLIKQLRISVLIVLGITTVDLVTSAAGSLRSGTFLSALGDWALNTAVFCALVVLVHSAIYTAARLGRPEGREARGVRAGLVALLLLDQVVIWSLLTTDSPRTPYTGGRVLVALLPLLVVVLAWGWSMRRGTGAAIARNTALLFGIVALLPQILAGALLVTFA